MALTDLYRQVSMQAARQLTESYSTSFSMASRLFASDIRPHIYNIYGLVRVADEIVDSYRGKDAGAMLDDLERETYQALERQYSSNIIVHAFAITARQFGIDRQLIEPFFASMRSDLTPQSYDLATFKAYIYGSAEVVGLMCLRVFVAGEQTKYLQLQAGAQALGAAFQKVNFLRDLSDDIGTLRRSYFPELQDSPLNETNKRMIVDNIMADFRLAQPCIAALPASSRVAVEASYQYYHELLQILDKAPADTILHHRLRVTNSRKLWLLGVSSLKARLPSA